MRIGVVDENMHVLDADGNQIPGLYANFLTAGGIAAKICYGSQWTITSLMGANGLSWLQRLSCCKSALAGK